MIQPDPGPEPAARPLVSPEVVVFPAEVDVSCSDAVGDSLRVAFRPGVSVVIADLSATEFCDSSAIRHLVLANNQAECIGVELRVVIPSPAVRRVLNVLEADQLLRLYPDVASALSGAAETHQQPPLTEAG